MPNENSSHTPPTDPTDQTLPQANVSPPTPQQEEMRNNPDDRPNDEESETVKLEKDIRRGEGWLIGINGSLLIATIVIAVIYFGQLRQMIESNSINREALESVQRAFIVWDSFVIHPTLKTLPSGSERNLVIENRWTNSGTTNARQVIHRFRVDGMKQEPDGIDFRGENEHHEIVYLSPKSSLGVNVPRPLSFFIPTGNLAATQNL
jgi:hypothetical protein